MSTKYQKSEEVPTKELLDRVGELIRAITGDRTASSFRNEFTMRIPAEVDRDADLVLQAIADRLDKAEKELAVAKAMSAKQANEIDRLRSVIEAESSKWKDHHDDQQWKAYWTAFAKKVHP